MLMTKVFVVVRFFYILIIYFFGCVTDVPEGKVYAWVHQKLIGGGTGSMLWNKAYPLPAGCVWAQPQKRLKHTHHTGVPIRRAVSMMALNSVRPVESSRRSQWDDEYRDKPEGLLLLYRL